MTAKVRSTSKCKKCKQDLVCRYCDTAHTCFTEFSDWIRDLNDANNYDVENLDYIRFHYREGWLITIEEKRNGRYPSPAQQDTHHIVSQMLALSSGREVETMRGKRPIEYRGHYIVSFENTNPLDSTWVKINNNQYENVVEVVTLLLTSGREHTKVK